MKPMIITIPLVAATLMLSGCAKSSPPGAASQGPAAANTAAPVTTPTPVANPDATPDHPIIDSPGAQTVCSNWVHPPGQLLLAAYDTTVGDVVDWQESDTGPGGSQWRDHAWSMAAWVCYLQGTFPIPCPPPQAGQAPCAPGTRESIIVSADRVARPFAVGYDWLSLTKPPPRGVPPAPYSPGPPPTPPTH